MHVIDVFHAITHQIQYKLDMITESSTSKSYYIHVHMYLSIGLILESNF